LNFFVFGCCALPSDCCSVRVTKNRKLLFVICMGGTDFLVKLDAKKL
jgi:hypothetical protein